MYYKIIKGNQTIEVCTGEIDDFLDDKNTFGEENVIEIEKEEFDKFSVISFAQTDEEREEEREAIKNWEKKERLKIKKEIFSLFLLYRKTTPPIERLQKYYEWIVE